VLRACGFLFFSPFSSISSVNGFPFVLNGGSQSHVSAVHLFFATFSISILSIIVEVSFLANENTRRIYKHAQPQAHENNITK